MNKIEQLVTETQVEPLFDVSRTHSWNVAFSGTEFVITLRPPEMPATQKKAPVKNMCFFDLDIGRKRRQSTKSAQRPVASLIGQLLTTAKVSSKEAQRIVSYYPVVRRLGFQDVSSSDYTEESLIEATEEKLREIFSPGDKKNIFIGKEISEDTEGFERYYILQLIERVTPPAVDFSSGIV